MRPLKSGRDGGTREGERVPDTAGLLFLMAPA
jgi:hypothetical protein